MSLVSARRIMDLRVVRRWRPPHRLAPATGYLAGFAGYFVVAILLSVLPIGHPAAIALVIVIAGLVGWWTTIPVAAGVAVLGWLFYSGFIIHSYGRLGIVGSQDAVVAGLLLTVAVGAALARTVAVRRAERPRELTLKVFPARGDAR